MLLASGASIHEINAVRKHISAIKGGQAGTGSPRPAHVLSLILSDVVGDDLDSIGSGPTAPGDMRPFPECIRHPRKIQTAGAGAGTGAGAAAEWGDGDSKAG